MTNLNLAKARTKPPRKAAGRAEGSSTTKPSRFVIDLVSNRGRMTRKSGHRDMRGETHVRRMSLIARTFPCP